MRAGRNVTHALRIIGNEPSFKSVNVDEQRRAFVVLAVSKRQH
ncbi:MAG: hypothetical protein AB7O52_17285 [Planctomycetota bacterium]